MAKLSDITAEYARQLLAYDPETGVLTWKARTPDMFKDGKFRTAAQECARWNTRFAGKPAGNSRNSVYIQVSINDRLYLAHRVIWLMMTGKWPDTDIDHDDTCKTNNRWRNLRGATDSQNHANVPRNKANKTGFKGVYLSPHGTYGASIKVNGKSRRLGFYKTPEEAHEAYKAAAQQEFKEFARTE